MEHDRAAKCVHRLPEGVTPGKRRCLDCGKELFVVEMIRRAPPTAEQWATAKVVMASLEPGVDYHLPDDADTPHIRGES